MSVEHLVVRQVTAKNAKEQSSLKGGSMDGTFLHWFVAGIGAGLGWGLITFLLGRLFAR